MESFAPLLGNVGRYGLRQLVDVVVPVPFLALHDEEILFRVEVGNPHRVEVSLHVFVPDGQIGQLQVGSHGVDDLFGDGQPRAVPSVVGVVFDNIHYGVVAKDIARLHASDNLTHHIAVAPCGVEKYSGRLLFGIYGLDNASYEVLGRTHSVPETPVVPDMNDGFLLRPPAPLHLQGQGVRYAFAVSGFTQTGVASPSSTCRRASSQACT